MTKVWLLFCFVILAYAQNLSGQSSFEMELFTTSEEMEKQELVGFLKCSEDEIIWIRKDRGEILTSNTQFIQKDRDLNGGIYYFYAAIGSTFPYDIITVVDRRNLSDELQTPLNKDISPLTIYISLIDDEDVSVSFLARIVKGELWTN